MINLEKIRSILWNISGDAGPLGGHTLPCDPSCIDLTKKNTSINCGKEPFDVIIIDKTFTDYNKLNKILANGGKIIALYEKDEYKAIVNSLNSTKIFFWREWIRSEGLVILKRWKNSKDNWEGQKAKKGETLTIYTERGWGDIFHNLRYLKKIQEVFDGKIFFEARVGLEKVIETNFNLEILTRGQNQKSTYFFEICRSKKIFGDLPDCQKYLTFPAQEKIADIGVAWDSHHLTFWDKTVDPLIFKNLSSKYKILSLQKFTHQKKDNTPSFLITKPIKDWYDTAKLINSVSVIASVDTGVAHLAAAMGKPVFVFLKGKYLTSINKKPSWYPKVHIIQQKENWEKTITESLLKIYL